MSSYNGNGNGNGSRNGKQTRGADRPAPVTKAGTHAALMQSPACRRGCRTNGVRPAGSGAFRDGAELHRESS